MHGTHHSLLKAIRILISVLILCLSLLLLSELYYLKILNGKLFLLAAAFVLALDALVILAMHLFTRKNLSQTICLVLAGILAASYAIGTVYISKTSAALDRLTSTSEKVRNVMDIYSLKDSPLEGADSLQGKTLGILTSINRTGTDKILDDLKAQGIDVKTKTYANFGPLANALYQKDVDAIVVNEINIHNITDLEAFTGFLADTHLVYQYAYYTDIAYSSARVDDITQQPFTVMINGSDSRGGLGDTDRSDVNMLVTINPKTEIVLMVSIPRDAYVETACDPEYDCLQGQYDKLTHTGLHTYHTTQKTLEKLLGVDINYVFRANFEAVIDVVDALGGIDVDVAPGYAVPYFWTNDMFGTSYGVHEGINHLNGQAALMYARERYAYKEGDFQRIRNQQEVLQKIAEKATSPEVIIRYTSLLDAIDGNFWTDISQEEIMGFIQYQMASNPKWTFITYSLSGQSDSLYCAEAYNYASVVVLDQNTVRTAKELIDAVVAGKSAQDINQMISDAAGLSPDISLEKEPETPDTESHPEDYYQPVQDVLPDTYPTYVPDDVYVPEQTPLPVVPPVQEVYPPAETVMPDPGYTEPGYTEPGYTEPGYTDPGYTDPGYADPGYTEPGYADSGTMPSGNTDSAAGGFIQQSAGIALP